MYTIYYNKMNKWKLEWMTDWRNTFAILHLVYCWKCVIVLLRISQPIWAFFSKIESLLVAYRIYILFFSKTTRKKLFNTLNYTIQFMYSHTHTKIFICTIHLFTYLYMNKNLDHYYILVLVLYSISRLNQYKMLNITNITTNLPGEIVLKY